MLRTLEVACIWLLLAWLTMVASSPSLRAAEIVHYDNAWFDGIHKGDITRFGVFHGTMAHNLIWNETHVSHGVLHVFFRAVRTSEDQLLINGHL